jgi:MFS family permease
MGHQRLGPQPGRLDSAQRQSRRPFRAQALLRGWHGRVRARVAGLRAVDIRRGTHRGTGVSRRRGRHDVGTGAVHPEPGVLRGTRAGAIGIWATCAGLGFGLGPVVGGLLLGVFGWSSVFWVNVPFAVAGIALTVTVVPESRNPDYRPLDVPGVLTSATGLLALTFGLIELSSSSWTSPLVWAPIATGFVLLASFTWREQRAPFPMIPSEVVKLRRFTISCGVYLVSYAALTAVYFYLTLLYQDVDGWTALRTGLSWLFMNVPFLVVAQFAGRLSRRLSASAIIAGGCLVTAAGVFTFSTLTPSSPFVIAVIGYVGFGTGTGMWIPGVANVAMRDVPPGLSGTASGVFNASRQVGTSAGLAILGAVEAGAATSAWGSHVAHLPRWRFLSRDFSSSLRRSSRYSGCVTTAGRSWTQPGLYQRGTPVPRRRRGSGHRRTGGHLAPALMIRSGRGYRAVATGRCHQTLVTLGGPALAAGCRDRPGWSRMGPGRVAYYAAACGQDSQVDFTAVRPRIRKYDDLAREFSKAGRRRELLARDAVHRGHRASARESYFTAAVLYGAGSMGHRSQHGIQSPARPREKADADRADGHGAGRSVV